MRSVLGFLVISALVKFQSSLKDKFGSNLANFHLLITLSQFHLIFYSSRTLPNTFALIFVLHAMHYRVRRKYTLFILTSGIAALIFRGETIILLGFFALYDLVVTKKLTFKTLFTLAPLIAIPLVALTVLVDSYFWKRWLWPEGEVQ